MKISELSQKTGLSIHTLRFYEKINIFPDFLIKRGKNNYREYDNEIIKIIRIVEYAKSAGFTLKEISENILSYRDGNMKTETKISLLKEKEKVIEKKLEEINFIKKIIREKINLLTQ